ncbi:hypothetical protein CRG98_016252 [Punica granatum]|uniref:Non-haem dioxygenase N-terminal domain-containing protein n=1 Tax=Punica granatum TaxID=22663 RepID=A0A2I0K491_PUNGR|nr:hypothetical protein CRG98_016252 [Punica granatum]
MPKVPALQTHLYRKFRLLLLSAHPLLSFLLPPLISAAAVKMSSVKTLAENPNLTCIPPAYTFPSNSPDYRAILSTKDGEGSEEPIPVIDFSFLISGTPDQRSKVVQELGYACREWGFFMVSDTGETIPLNP